MNIVPPIPKTLSILKSFVLTLSIPLNVLRVSARMFIKSFYISVNAQLSYNSIRYAINISIQQNISNIILQYNAFFGGV